MEQLSEKDIANFNRRKDNRTEETFAYHIKIHTEKENVITSIWKDRFYADAELIDNGTDNSGKLVKEAAKVSRKPDFELLLPGGGKRHLEIKTSPVGHIATFKVADLEAYLRQPQTEILLFINAGDYEKDKRNFPKRDTQWAILTHEMMQEILRVGTRQTFKSFGNKLCVRVTVEQLKNICQLERLFD